MQKVSDYYKSGMKKELRDRGYMKVYFGLIDAEAHQNAKIDDNAEWEATRAFYSDNDIFANNTVSDYATLEQDFTRIDDTHLLLSNKSSTAPTSTGVVTDKLVSDMQTSGQQEDNRICIYFGQTEDRSQRLVSFKGLSIDFGDNYPTEFAIQSEGTTSSQNTVYIGVKDNTLSTWSTDTAFDDCTAINIYIYSMKSEQTRFRIHSMTFGQGLLYDNEKIISSTLETYVSPIAEDVPQIDFSVTIENYDKYFDADNPNSALNFIETGQILEAWYGYDTYDENDNFVATEWVKGGTLYCTEWEANDESVTIKGQDYLRNLETEYYKGQYSANGETFYNLAEAVFEDAGITDYYIDSELKTLTTTAPVPYTTHKAALQIIANACRCVLSQNRNGRIEIKSNHKSEFTATSNGAESYSKLSLLFEQGTDYLDYAILSTDWVMLNRSSLFPTTTKRPYVSSQISNADCTFTTNPVLTLTQTTLTGYYSFYIKFGRGVPDEFVITTYDESNTLVDTVTKSGDEIQVETSFDYEFNPFVKMLITFTKTKRTYNHISVMKIGFDDKSDFIMTKTDMLGSPTCTKQEKVKQVLVPGYSYTQSGSETTLVNEDITSYAVGDVFTYKFSEAVYDLSVKLGGSTSNVTVTGQGCYYITFTTNKKGTFTLEITGKMFTINNYRSYVLPNLNQDGTTVTWENPMITSQTQAKAVAEWLREYYLQPMEYEYDTRGNPELDTGDYIQQSSNFDTDFTVQINRTVMEFNGAFSGRVTTRRLIDG